MTVMAMVVTLKHPVLGYCLCLDTYFTGDCVCEVDTVSSNEIIACEDDCSATCAVSKKTDPSPCDDCTQQLTVETEDFIWAGAHKKIPVSNQNNKSTQTFVNDWLLSWQNIATHDVSIRGSPPSIDIFQEP